MKRSRRTAAWALLALVSSVAVAAPEPAGARQAGAPPPGQEAPFVGSDTVRVRAGRTYPAGWVHRLMLGDNNRALWELEFDAPVLDLGEFAGGLTVVRRGGGQQTQSLRLEGADGVQYNFRSFDKDASRTLDPELRSTIAAEVLQDQISALMPLSALVVSPLLEAAGVLHARPHLAVMPDDPRLGEFREEFAGLVGVLEERPDEGPDNEPGFAGSDRVVSSPRFFERIEEDQEERPDAVAFLQARLMDFLVGDWDRHPDQWRWAGYEDERGDRLFYPVPRDRDWALSRIGGVLVWMAQTQWLQYVGFDEDYPSAMRLSWTGRGLDRLILPALDWPTWEATARDLSDRLTDEVIRDAVENLPPSYYDEVGDFYVRALIARRDGLLDKAREFYELLAEEVDVQGTDEEDLAVVEYLEGDSLRVSLHPLGKDGEADGPPYFQRIFREDDTREIRVYLRGDDDRAVVRGEAPSSITLRFVGGGSDDVLVNEAQRSGHRVHFYDHRGDNEFSAPRGTWVDEGDFDEPQRAEDAIAPPRDWGRRWWLVPRARAGSEIGLAVGASAVRRRYGFRHYPYATELTLTAAIGTTTGRWFLSGEYDFPVYRQAVRGTLLAQWNAVEAVDFFGLGNETPGVAETDQARALQGRGLVGITADFELAESLTLSVGPLVEFFRPALDDNLGTVVDSIRPYGYSDFDQIGAAGILEFDTRDEPVNPLRGFHVRVAGRTFLPLADVDTSFSVLSGQAAAYASADWPGQPVLALRAGGAKTWGKVPYHQLATIGGSPNVRGLRRNRFTGDSSLYGSAELRLRVASFFLLVPMDMGVLGLGDTGRVWLEGESSDRWHSSWGGGIWASAVQRKATVSLTIARSSESTRFYALYGFGF